MICLVCNVNTHTQCSKNSAFETRVKLLLFDNTQYGNITDYFEMMFFKNISDTNDEKIVFNLRL